MMADAAAAAVLAAQLEGEGGGGAPHSPAPGGYGGSSGDHDDETAMFDAAVTSALARPADRLAHVCVPLFSALWEGGFVTFEW